MATKDNRSKNTKGTGSSGPPVGARWAQTQEGLTVVKPIGIHQEWGTFIRTVTRDEEDVVIHRHRDGALLPGTNIAVAIPFHRWEAMATGKHKPARGSVLPAEGEPADDWKQSTFRPNATAAYDKLERGMHILLWKYRDYVAVFVPIDWYRRVTGMAVGDQLLPE